MPFADINGIRLHYQDTGTGEPLLLVMGMGASGRAWELYQVPAFIDAGYRVITFDNRGCAPTDECPDGFTIDDLVADTAGLIEHLDLGPCRLVGTSMGAQVVQELSLARPDLVRQAVLMATRGRQDVMRTAMSEAERDLRSGDQRLPARYEATTTALLNFSPKTLDDDATIRDWLDVFEYSPTVWTPGLRAQLDVGIEPGRLEAYRRIRVRCLVLGFTDDIQLPPHLAREVADAIPAAEYLQLDDCGHYGYLERPDPVNHAILEFFAD